MAELIGSNFWYDLAPRRDAKHLMIYRVIWHIILIYIYRSSVCYDGRGICSLVSPGNDYFLLMDKNECSGLESGVVSECLCWIYRPFGDSIWTNPELILNPNYESKKDEKIQIQNFLRSSFVFENWIINNSANMWTCV